MTARKKCLLGCLKTGVRELKMLRCACTREAFNIFGFLWAKFLKINKEKNIPRIWRKNKKRRKEKKVTFFGILKLVRLPTVCNPELLVHCFDGTMQVEIHCNEELHAEKTNGNIWLIYQKSAVLCKALDIKSKL